MDLDDYVDYERKADRESGRDPRERLGGRHRITERQPKDVDVDVPVQSTYVNGRTLPSAIKRPEHDVAFPNGGARWVDSDENMGGHSMHTGDNSTRKYK